MDPLRSFCDPTVVVAIISMNGDKLLIKISLISYQLVLKAITKNYSYWLIAQSDDTVILFQLSTLHISQILGILTKFN